jgi:hypothetical protein
MVCPAGNLQNDTYQSYRHSGLDPESSAYLVAYDTGCRIKPGMTGRN